MKSVRNGAVVVLLLLGIARATSAEQVIFLVRHAEKAASPVRQVTPAMTAAGDDPPLSAAGRERAARLAAILRSAGIAHVFSTEFLRTRTPDSTALLDEVG